MQYDLEYDSYMKLLPRVCYTTIKAILDLILEIAEVIYCIYLLHYIINQILRNEVPPQIGAGREGMGEWRSPGF